MSRFLIIEDEPTVSQTFARMLELDGHTVALVESAAAAMDLLERDLPHAIILDIRMPGIGGLEFLRRLRADARTRPIPVGVVTGDHFLREEVLAEIDALGGTVRYKPLWLDDVSALARHLLNA